MKLEYREPAQLDETSASAEIVHEENPVDEIQELAHAYGGISRLAAQRIWDWCRAREGRTTDSIQVERLRSIIAFFASGMTKTSFWGLMYAADITDVIGELNIQERAKQQGCTKQAISKEATKWRDRLRLPQSKSMRAEETRGHFQAAAHRAHGTNGSASQPSSPG